MSKQIDIPLSEKPYYNTDAIANAIASDDMMNVYLEPVLGVGPSGGTGFITRRRPGFVIFCDLLTAVPGDGILYWDAMNKVIAVSGGRVFDVKKDGTFEELYSTPKTYASANNKGYLIEEKGIMEVSLLLTSNPSDRVSHKITITSEFYLSDSTFVVTGIDNNNELQKEPFAAGPNNGTVTGNLYFGKIISIVPTITTPDSFLGLVTGATGAGPFTIISGQPPKGFACKFYASSSTNLSGISITVVGKDIYDESQTEVIAAGPSSQSPITGIKYFKSFASISISSTYGGSTADFGWKGGKDNFLYNGSFDFGWATDYLDPVSVSPDSNIPVTFADGQRQDSSPWLYLASGNLIFILDDMRLYRPVDLNVPNATHIAWMNSRFIANESGTNKWYFTDTNPATGTIESDYWGSTDNPVTAEARGDKLSALFTAFQDIYVWGTEGLEIWQDDGVTPFSAIQGAFSEAGIEGPYAYGKIDNTVFALCVIEGKRVIVRMEGRSPKIVSEPIARIISEFTTVSDALCDIITVGGIAIALFSFPSANQSWAYDYKNDTWLRWGYYVPTTGDHDRFLGQRSCFAKTWNKHLIQSRVDGKIYRIDRNIFSDG